MAKRITGLETEYGCLVENEDNPRDVIERIRDWFFENDRYGLLDLHDRDWDESAGNGGFLFNGGRVYIDMGHLEYCTPECASVHSVVQYDSAGDRLLQESVKALGLSGRVCFIRNNIDHYTGATFGCHENYSLSRMAPLSESNVLSLLGFLTLRILMAGTGRVGAARVHGRPHTFIPFQISQRADYIQNDFYEWVQHNRAIINTRDEPLADPWKYRRLHLIHGDTNVLRSALYLKIGSTRLALDLMEEDALPAVALEDAVATMRTLSRAPDGPWRICMRDGSEADALALLDQYRARAAELFAGRDEETDAVLGLWQRVIHGLAGDKSSLIGVVDWITKRHLIETFCRETGVSRDDPWLEAQDLEYHQIDPQRCLAQLLAEEGIWSREPKADARMEPPSDTRAAARSRLMRKIGRRGLPYVLDWESVAEANAEPTLLLDPFDGSEP